MWNGPVLTGVHDGLDFDARYAVTSMSGVAFALIGWAQNECPETCDLTCPYPPGSCDHESQECWTFNPPEFVDNTSVVRAVMVGDDRELEVDRSELKLISDDDYCSGCGQIGCGH